MPPSIKTIECDQWLELSSRFLDHNYRQCWNYGIALAQRRHAISRHVAILYDGEVIGLADVRIRPAPFVGGGIAYISGGPLVRQGRDDDFHRLSQCLEALRREYVEKEGCILRIQGSLGPETWNRRAASCFIDAGFHPTRRSRTYRTLVVDVRRPLPAIREAFAQKWRNGLNRAQRNDLTIHSGNDADIFQKFCNLFDEFIQRKTFNVDLDARFFAALPRQLPPSESLLVTIAEKDGLAIAGHLCSMLGDTCVYLLGATCEAGLKYNAAYLLQWNAITLANQRGLRFYDLGGIDPDGNPGVYHFKQGMGGDEVTAPGPFELAPDRFRASLMLHAESLYQSLRKLRPAKASGAS